MCPLDFTDATSRSPSLLVTRSEILRLLQISMIDLTTPGFGYEEIWPECFEWPSEQALAGVHGCSSLSPFSSSLHMCGWLDVTHHDATTWASNIHVVIACGGTLSAPWRVFGAMDAVISYLVYYHCVIFGYIDQHGLACGVIGVDPILIALSSDASEDYQY